jgi:hypothetical protein
MYSKRYVNVPTYKVSHYQFPSVNKFHGILRVENVVRWPIMNLVDVQWRMLVFFTYFA